MFKDKKTIIYGTILAVLLIVAYFVMFAGGDGEVVTVASQDPTSAVSQELITTLTSLNTIRLDESLFSDPTFVSLSDFGVVIPTQPIGRRNPFAPL